MGIVNRDEPEMYVEFRRCTTATATYAYWNNQFAENQPLEVEPNPSDQ